MTIWPCVVITTNHNNLPAYFGKPGRIFRAMMREAGGPELPPVKDPATVRDVYMGTFVISRIIDTLRAVHEALLYGTVRRVWPEADKPVSPDLTWRQSLERYPQRWCIADEPATPDRSKQHWIVGVDAKSTGSPWDPLAKRCAAVFIHSPQPNEDVEAALVDTVNRFDEHWKVAIDYLRDVMRAAVEKNTVDPLILAELQRNTYPLRFDPGYLERTFANVPVVKVSSHGDMVRVFAKLTALSQAVLGENGFDFRYPPGAMVVPMVDPWGILGP